MWRWRFSCCLLLAQTLCTAYVTTGLGSASFSPPKRLVGMTSPARSSSQLPSLPAALRRRGGATPRDMDVSGGDCCSPLPSNYDAPDPRALQSTAATLTEHLDPSTPVSLPFRTLLTEIAIASWAPLMLAALNIWAYRTRHGAFPVEQEELTGAKVLVEKEWHRIFTSLFLHGHVKELGVSCAGLVSAGTVCSLLFGQVRGVVPRPVNEQCVRQEDGTDVPYIHRAVIQVCHEYIAKVVDGLLCLVYVSRCSRRPCCCTW